jgi:catechol 2,3-dioxygenase-like lactoylglutathione lyase family enzyme
MRIAQLNHVALHVEDVEKSCEFYRDVLQLPQIPRPAFDFPGAWFALGDEGQQLHLIGERDKPVNSHSRGTHFALRVDNMAEVLKQFRQQEANFLGPRPRPDGATQIFLQDPDGHWIELCQLPE